MKIISVAMQKGGVGKTTVAANLSFGLAREGKKVLAIDADPQGNLTTCMGFRPYDLDYSLSDIARYYTSDDNDLDGQFNPFKGILHNEEGVDIMPTDISLSDMQLNMNGAICREMMLKWYVDQLKETYDYIIIDSEPSMSILSLNVLACADSVIIPLPTEYLPTEGLAQLLSRIMTIRKRINPHLNIEGILFAKVKSRTKDAQDIINQVTDAYGSKLNIYSFFVPDSVKVSETPALGISIFKHDPKGKAAESYTNLVREVLTHG